MNNITITGYISSINVEKNNYIWFNICVNEKFKDKNGEEVSQASFFNARIKNDSKYKDNLVKGKLVTVVGKPKIYTENDNQHFFIHAFGIKEYKKEDKMISYDTDGVMIWNGKRCESKEATPEEVAEMEALLSEFQ